MYDRKYLMKYIFIYAPLERALLAQFTCKWPFNTEYGSEQIYIRLKYTIYLSFYPY